MVHACLFVKKKKKNIFKKTSSMFEDVIFSLEDPLLHTLLVFQSILKYLD